MRYLLIAEVMVQNMVDARIWGSRLVTTKNEIGKTQWDLEYSKFGCFHLLKMQNFNVINQE
jgi:hypothetical protein